jgi:pSer/pThr/pTyr-binding forkhead associated (FHA) protein
VTVGNDVIILGLRLGVVLVLYLFLFALVVLTQRELHRAGARRQPQAQGRPRLIVVDPGTAAQTAGQVIPLEPVTRFGRASDQTVVLDDEFVSASHAMVVLRNGRWWVRDEGSTNGTLVNGAPVESETALNEGDELQIGQVVLRLVE